MRRLLLLGVLVGCSPQITLHPDVEIDASFSPEERTEILDGLSKWEAAVPEIRFTSYIVDAGRIRGDAKSHEYANTIYIVRVTGPRDYCPSPGITYIGEDAVAREWSYWGQALICMDGTFINTHPFPASITSGWSRVTMHEVGHALHLDHMPQPSVMAPGYWLGAPEPTEQDIAAIDKIWGLPHLE